MSGPVTNLRSLDSANFKTSKRADGVNELMKSKLGLQHRYEPARLAIAHSLAMPDSAPRLSDDDADDSGKVIMGKTLFGDDELPLWVALIVEKAGIPVAALVSTEDLKRLNQFDRERAERFALLDELRAPFRDVPTEEIEREVDRALNEVRAEARAEREHAIVKQ